MPPSSRRLHVIAAIAVLLLTACSTSKLLWHQANPEYVGKPFRQVMVHAVAYDKTLRRVFEDRMVARLGERGIRGVPAYSIFDKDVEIEESRLREAVEQSGVDGVLITRPGAEDRTTTQVAGGTIVTGTGMVGLYGYYGGVWQVTEAAPKKAEGARWMASTTRLFDASNGAPVWAGTVDMAMEGDVMPAMQRYIDIVVRAMVKDGVI